MPRLNAKLTNYGQAIRSSVLPWLLVILASVPTADAAFAATGCSTPAFTYTGVFQILVEQTCSTLAEARAECDVMTAPFQPYHSVGCHWNGKNGAWSGYAGHYRIAGELPFYFFRFNVPAGPVADQDKNRGVPDCKAQCFGDPVNAGTGNSFEQRREYAGQGRLPLEVSWTYNSLGLAQGRVAALSLFGRNRLSNYSRQLDRFDYNGYSSVSLIRPDGNILRFTLEATGWASNTGRGERLVEVNGDSVAWRFVGTDDVTEEFSLDGRLIALRSTDGSHQTLIYDAKARLVAVEDRQGREISFEYNNFDLVSKLTDPKGLVTRFSYTKYKDLSAVTYADGTTVQYLYDEPGFVTGYAKRGLLTGIINELGVRHVSKRYDAEGRATYTALADGTDEQTAAYTTDVTGTFASSTVVSTQPGHRRAMSFAVKNGWVRPVVINETCDNCAPSQTRITYDETGNPLSIDASGVQRVYSYDDRGRVAVLKEAASNPNPLRTTLTEWHDYWNVRLREHVLGADGAVVKATEWGVNQRGQIVSESVRSAGVASPRISTWTYCEQADVARGLCPFVGQLTALDGPRTDVNDQTVLVYYPTSAPGCDKPGAACPYRKGDLWMVQDAVGNTVEMVEFDGGGNLIGALDPNGLYTRVTRDARGRFLSRTVSDASGPSQILSVSYLANGLIQRSDLPSGDSVQYFYDQSERLVRIQEGGGQGIDFTLDGAGRRTGEVISDAGGSVRARWRRIFNARGEKVSSIDAYGNASVANYDTQGNLTKVIAPSGVVEDRVFDSIGRLVSYTQDARLLATNSSIAYDTLDRVTSVVDPRGLTTRYAYDNYSGLSEMESPDGGRVSFIYDEAGNVTRAVDAMGQAVTYKYDGLNRLVAKVGDREHAYVYDVASADCKVGERFAVGRLSLIDDSKVKTAICYGPFGNVVRKTQAVGSVKLSLATDVGPSGEVDSMTYPDGWRIQYLRNPQGAVQEVRAIHSSAGSQVLMHSISHHPFGPLRSWVFGNGRRVMRHVDFAYRPTEIEGGDGGLNVGLAYDTDGNVARLSVDNGSRMFAYDGLGRLTDTADPNRPNSLVTYRYDGNGNRISRVSENAVEDYVYAEDSNKLQEVGGIPRGYDAAGSTVFVGTQRSYAYDRDGRMSSVSQDGLVLARYLYNAKGEQIKKDFGSYSVISFFDEQSRWIGDYDQNGKSIQQAVWLGNRLIGLLVGQQLFYVQVDHLGSPRVVIDPVRDAPVWSWDMTADSFGSSLPNEDADDDGQTFKLEMRFPGQRFDEVSGLVQNMNRDYDPGVGRYVQVDPIGLAGGQNVFAYAESNPLSKYDPDGLKATIGPAASFDRRARGSIRCQNGVVSPFLMNISNAEMGCFGSCIMEHELSHARDAESSNPGVCKYGGWMPLLHPVGSVTFPTEGPPGVLPEYFRSEFRAHAIEAACLTSKLEKSDCDGRSCNKRMRDRIREIVDIHWPAVVNGTYGRGD
ncbi:RHS repeat-associated core domain-containing protein [Stenotrophomonas chelatiphaga]|uniref:RHS repeat-associated core domain-containing protein n=1 Tax=Stenotrophomonas chelatiphaga TaxID=517011 RepID=UPI00289A2A42|nr:RHS repeat-associated core domain-containing protein [Stenotrophomonas chelatiphaga]